MGSEQETVAELNALEARRCQAISSGDLETVRSLVDEELTHTHRTGKTQGKADYLDGLAQNPRATTRGDLLVRVFGDVAIMTGHLINQFPPQHAGPSRVVNQATQVWVRRTDGWKEVAYAASGPIPDSELHS